jgi:hypothetical protein
MWQSGSLRLRAPIGDVCKLGLPNGQLYRDVCSFMAFCEQLFFLCLQSQLLITDSFPMMSGIPAAHNGQLSYDVRNANCPLWTARL